MIESFKLDTYLTKEYIFSTIKEDRVKELPEIDFILYKIKSFLKEYRFSKSISGYGQRYYAKFTFDNNNYCIISWDIERAKMICQNKNIRIVNLSVNKLAKKVAKDAINSNFLTKGLYNYSPIIIADIPIVNSFAIIDGNHRVMGRYKNNINNISGYYMDSKYHYFAMGNDTSRALFISLTIVDNIKGYLTGKISKSNLIKEINKMYKFYYISAEKEMLEM